jgi:hypothetical protein
MENTLKGEINTESLYFSVNYNTNFKNFFDSFYLHYMGYIKPKNHLSLLSL